MATAAWLHGPKNVRLTEGLVSALKEERPEYLPALLANYREHGVVGTQNSGTVGGLVGISNSRLGSSKTRFEGLCLLSMLVKDSSSEVFQQHCLSWLRSLQQIIQSQAPLPSVQLAVSVLQDVLQYSSQLPELAREVGLNSILGILTSLLGLKSECHLAAMEGMMACMTYYPRACGSLKEKLGVYFLSKMDSDNPKVQDVACECYGWLPCLGGVLERGGGGRRAEGWTSQVHCLLASANSILGQLYQGIETEETIQYEGPGVELPFPPLDEVDPLLILQLRHRYRAVCLALKHTLSVDPATSVRLPIQHVLNVVCRALAVSIKNINVTSEGCLKLLVLPSVHSDSLEVLSALIKAVGAGLVQYCNVLSRLFSQALCAWTSLPEASLGQQRAYSAVRVALYRTLELWVRVGRASSSVLQGSSSHSELLFAHLIGDITPGTEAVKLRAGQTAMSDLVAAAGKTGPRRTKGMGIGDPGGVSLQRKGDALANQDTCFAALRVLKQIVLTSGTLLKEDLHKKLQELVVPLCVKLQQQAQYSNWDVGSIGGQYGSASPRCELYALLLALVLVPSPRWPAPLSCAVCVFSQGRRDRNITVSSFCAEALTICNALLHPRTPSISLPLPPLTLKPTPAASVLAPTQNPSLSLPTLMGAPAPGPSFAPRHPLSLGPASLLGSLENHLPLGPPVLPTSVGATGAQGDLLLSSPAQAAELAGLAAPPETQRQVFLRYDKEEPEDVEISLESDSDDSVVIMPQGMMLEMQEGAANTQSLPPPSGSAITVPNAGLGSEAGPVESSLSSDLPTSIGHQMLPADANNINSFPGSSQTEQLVSLVPPLNSNSVPLAVSSAALGNSLPAGAQLQQMLMQPSPGGQPSQLGLSLHMQLQNQLVQSSRQPAASEQDQNVININSTDDEEEEEDEEMEDEDELGEEEEEEEGLDEDEEEEEGSDFHDVYYQGADFEAYDDDDEGEEMEEEEDEEDDEEDIQQLDADNRRDVIGAEEREVMIEGQEERGVGTFPMEGERPVEGGIEEMKAVQSIYEEEDIKDKGSIEEIENIGAVERNESVVGEQQIETLVIGAEGEQSEENASVDAADQEVQPQEQEGSRSESVVTPEDSGISPGGQEQEVAVEVRDNEPSAKAEQEEIPNPSTATTSEDTAPQVVVETAEKEVVEGTKVEEEEARGTKRKLEDQEEGEVSEQNSEKKKLDDEAMASMLADFVDCPPDDEDRSASHSHS
ncbi:proline-, glutamic acid- and leucine-rich protein 1 [Ictalurus punctatus]|uniref:Proline-, glutamic acid- and leucine-rich protein 1 n=1 Tax=Ictalurus punctatus TaxID=7998 RepID=A0A2D0RAA6_ICTPU|nr:proline-, glutamic acid- and leucine-rich protein 1 [Ictalurus punctatus]